MCYEPRGVLILLLAITPAPFNCAPVTPRRTTTWLRLFSIAVKSHLPKTTCVSPSTTNLAGGRAHSTLANLLAGEGRTQ